MIMTCIVVQLWIIFKKIKSFLTSKDIGLKIVDEGERVEIYLANCICLVQKSMECSCLCTNSTNEKSNFVLNRMAPRATRHILVKSSHTIINARKLCSFLSRCSWTCHCCSYYITRTSDWIVKYKGS